MRKKQSSSTNEPAVLAARRRLLQTIAVTGGAVVAARELPRRGVRPIVDSVLLPAHAQASSPGFVTTLICDATPPDGSETQGGDLHTATVSVIPAPATGSNVSVEGFCDGATQGIIATLQTDAAGQVVFSEVLPGVLDCGSQLELREYRLRFSFEGVTTDCFWTVRIS